MKALKNYLCVLLAVVCSTFFYSCQEMGIEAGLKIANKDLPMAIAEGMTLEEITMGDNGFVYNITVDEEYYEIDAIKTSASEVKQEIISGLKESCHDDNELKDFLKLAVDNNKPLNYKYEGNVSGEAARIKISVNELKGILE